MARQARFSWTRRRASAARRSCRCFLHQRTVSAASSMPRAISAVISSIERAPPWGLLKTTLLSCLTRVHYRREPGGRRAWLLRGPSRTRSPVAAREGKMPTCRAPGPSTAPGEALNATPRLLFEGDAEHAPSRHSQPRPELPRRLCQPRLLASLLRPDELRVRQRRHPAGAAAARPPADGLRPPAPRRLLLLLPSGAPLQARRRRLRRSLGPPPA